MPCERTLILYMPNQRYESHHKICNLRYGTPDTLLPLQVQSVAPRQTPGTIGFSHRLCSVMFSLYDNKMSSIFSMHTNDFYCWKYKVENCTHEHSYVLNFSAKWNLVPNRLWKLRLFRDFITQLFRRASNTNEFVFDALALIISYTWKTDFGFADRNEIILIVIMKKNR